MVDRSNAACVDVRECSSEILRYPYLRPVHMYLRNCTLLLCTKYC